MNKQEKDILNTLYHQSVNNQREISELSGHSLGVVNKSIKAGWLADISKMILSADARLSSEV